MISFGPPSTHARVAYQSEPKDDVNSGFWSVIEINIGVICICLPPLRALLSRHLHFLTQSRTGADASERPYPLGYVKTDPNSSKASEQRPVHHAQGRMYPEQSEEELVSGRDDNRTLESMDGKSGGIMKTTQIFVTERKMNGVRIRRDDSDIPEEVKDWQMGMR